MANSIVVICGDSPFGKNSAIESIRLATGILSVGDIDNCKVIFIGDAVYFLNKNLDPTSLNMDPFTDIMRLVELSKLEIYVLDKDLEEAGMDRSDLISHDKLKILNIEAISQLILDADLTFKF